LAAPTGGDASPGGHVYDSSQSFNSGIITTVPTGGDSGPLPPVPHYQT
jgi:hypothetical protein